MVRLISEEAYNRNNKTVSKRAIEGLIEIRFSFTTSMCGTKLKLTRTKQEGGLYKGRVYNRMYFYYR